MKHRVLTTGLIVFFGATCLHAAELGSLSGVVKEPMGQPAAGIAISIRSVGSLLPIERKALSDTKGQFYFSALFPGVYTIQVLSVEPWNIISKELVVTPGRNDALVIHLSDIFTMAFKPPRIAAEREDPVDDAKWVLRTSRVTRPILRFRGSPAIETVAARTDLNGTLPFRGILDISSASSYSNGSLDGDPFNSSFAFMHPLSPRTQLLVAGGFGFASSNQCSVRSALNIKLDEVNTATVSVGLRQFDLPLFNGSELSQALASLADGTSISQIQNLLISLDVQDRVKLGDHVELMAGATFDHLESVRSKNILRPRIGVSADLSPTLAFHALAMNTTTEQAKTFNLPEGESITLPSMARMSISRDATRPESVNHFELSFEKKIADQARLFFGLYQDQFRNRSLFLSTADVFDGGSSTQRGYSVAIITHPRPRLSISTGYSYAGGLEESGAPVASMEHMLDENRILRTRNYHIWTGGVGYQFPRTHTQITTLYRKIFGAPLTIVDPFQTNFYASEAGLNLLITQPLPNITLLPGQLEAQADFRNLFAEGFSNAGSVFPIAFLSQQPRVVRGGLSFKF
jgi:hypothetical protein